MSECKSACLSVGTMLEARKLNSRGWLLGSVVMAIMIYFIGKSVAKNKKHNV